MKRFIQIGFSIAIAANIGLWWLWLSKVGGSVMPVVFGSFFLVLNGVLVLGFKDRPVVAPLAVSNALLVHLLLLYLAAHYLQTF